MCKSLRYQPMLICILLTLLQPLAAFSQDHPVRKWKLEHTFDIHNQGVSCVACSANLIATLDGSGVIRIWDRASGNLKNKPDRQLEGKPAWLMFSPDGKYLYAAAKDVSGMKLLMFDVSTDLSKKLNIGYAETSDDIMMMTFATEADTWAQIRGNTVQLVRVDLAERLKEKPPTPGENIGVLKGHTKQVSALVFSLDGKVVVTGSQDQSVRVWDFASQRLLATLKGKDASVTQVACDPQGRNIASIDDKGNLFCWNLEKDKRRFDPQKNVSTLSFSCEGRHLAYGDKQGKIHLFDLKNNKAVLNWDGHEQSVNAILFSPDGKSLITSGQEGKAKLWQLE